MLASWVKRSCCNPHSPGRGPDPSRPERVTPSYTRWCSARSLDILALVFDLEGVLVVTGSLAGGAEDFHVGHERELRRDRPFAGALLAATALDVEAEGRGSEVAPFGLIGLGKQRTDRVIEADVGRRVGARGPPDRGLIDVDHVADVLTAGEFVVLAGKDAAIVQERIETLLDDLVNE